MNFKNGGFNFAISETDMNAVRILIKRALRVVSHLLDNRMTRDEILKTVCSNRHV